jgi:hypothetical protein
VHDNCFEADGAMHNIRIFNNRCFNVATGGMSPQPIFDCARDLQQSMRESSCLASPTAPRGARLTSVRMSSVHRRFISDHRFSLVQVCPTIALSRSAPRHRAVGSSAR